MFLPPSQSFNGINKGNHWVIFTKCKATFSEHHLDFSNARLVSEVQKSKYEVFALCGTAVMPRSVRGQKDVETSH